MMQKVKLSECGRSASVDWWPFIARERARVAGIAALHAAGLSSLVRPSPSSGLVLGMECIRQHGAAHFGRIPLSPVRVSLSAGGRDNRTLLATAVLEAGDGSIAPLREPWFGKYPQIPEESWAGLWDFCFPLLFASEDLEALGELESILEGLRAQAECDSFGDYQRNYAAGVARAWEIIGAIGGVALGWGEEGG